jgi:hypothetical protein
VFCLNLSMTMKQLLYIHERLLWASLPISACVLMNVAWQLLLM